MNLRIVICALGLLTAVPAQAQDVTNPATAPTPAPSAEHLAAGENLARAVIFDGGAVQRIFEHMDTSVIPELRQSILSSPIYRGANAERREALMQVIDDLPNYMRQELNAGLGAVTVESAPRFAERMSAEHLNETAAFMRSDEIRARWRGMVEARIEMDKPMPSFPDWRDVGAFAQTPAGLAFAENEEELGNILDEEAERTLSLIFPRMLATVRGQMCDALRSDCPQHLRDSAGRI